MIGEGIKFARNKRGLTQGELAKKIGTDQAYISLLEKGRKTPSFKIIDRISEALDFPSPLISWYGVKREDVPEDKRALFDILKPSIDQMLAKIFTV